MAKNYTQEAIAKIRAFVFDVDGVMTDGGILGTETGELYRVYDAKDGFALRMASMHGYKMGIITGGRSESILKRGLKIGFEAEDIYLHSRNKIDDFNDFCKRHDLKPEEVMYFGDDIPDLCVMEVCGISACPCDAVEDVKQTADFVSSYPGGKCFVRNAVETIMKIHGTWVMDAEGYKRF